MLLNASISNLSFYSLVLSDVGQVSLGTNWYMTIKQEKEREEIRDRTKEAS